MKKTAVWLVVALAGLGAAPTLAQQKSTVIQKIIVKVNGEIFTQTDLEDQQILALRAKNPQLRSLQDLQNDAALRAALAEVTPDVLVDAVDELLLVQRARETGARFTDENFKLAIENVKKQNKLDDESLKVALQQEGLTMAELRENFERTYLQQVITQQEVGRSMTLTEQEARQYYAAHPDQFMKPASVTVREIFVAVPTVTGPDGKPAINAAANEEAIEKLKTTRERAVKGEDFAKLAAEISESGTKANGGLIGPVLVSDLDPALAEIFTKLTPGEISEPIRTTDGYRLFKLDTRTAPEPEPYDKVRDDISQKIYSERLEGETKKFVEKLREVALIEWKDAAYKELYEKRLAELAAARKAK
jgi:peptidyl-prolyl cis-trans isomerase SurA